MSIKYKSSKDVPTKILSERLNELADAVVARLKGNMSKYEREFTVRIPAECDRDADLVLSEASRRLKDLNTRAEPTVKKEEEYLGEILEEMTKGMMDKYPPHKFTPQYVCNFLTKNNYKIIKRGRYNGL